MCQSEKYELKPSYNLRLNAYKEWMNEIRSFESLMNHVLRLTHPNLWHTALEAKQELACRLETHEVSKRWYSLFTGIAVIVNRITVPHIDRGGRPEWYDLLVSAGNPEKAVLEIPQLGAQIRYNSGAMVLLCGKSLVHSVGHWGSGDRICLAHFLRANVFKRLHIQDVSWSMQPWFLKGLDNL